jgi:hypothetical protein
MRLAHLINTLARFSKELAELFSALGARKRTFDAAI